MLGLYCAVICGIYIAIHNLKRRERPLPPGPRPWPLIGNMLDIPQANHWIAFARWKEQYGDLVHVNLFGIHFVILNSAKVVADILEKRSSKSSGRPHSVMINELMRPDWMILKGYTTIWRTYRRLFHAYFNEGMSASHQPAQERAVHHLLRRLLDQPEAFLDHIRLQFAEVIMDVVYDIPVGNYQNIFVQTAERAVQALTQAAIPGKFLVELFTFLKYVPAWFPGAGFKRLAIRWKSWTDQSMDLPFAHYKENVQRGTAGPSMLSFLIEKCETEGETATAQTGLSADQLAKVVAGNAYAAGSDTTLTAVQTFFLFMANHPECQREAQAELDVVLGSTTRLPNFDDLNDLPYIHALANESLRLQPVLPTGVGHSMDEDDVYEGYLIPKDAILMPNTWLILRDPETYPNPHSFDPSRWLIRTEKGLVLNKAVPEPVATFGYGRRICPGRFFAKDSMLLTIASVLACFDISPLDPEGKPTDSLPEIFAEGLVMYPKPFKLSIIPRSKATVDLLQDIDLPA